MRTRADRARASRAGLRVVAAIAAMAMAIALHVTPAASQGVGIAPGFIEVDDALRSGTYSDQIRLDNSQETDLVFRFLTDGDIADWIRITDVEDRSTEVETMRVGAGDSGIVRAEFNVPDDAPNSVYEGRILVVSDAADADVDDGSGASVRIGAQIPVTINVTGSESRSGIVSDTFVAPAEVGGNQRFTAKVVNEGNVLLEPELTVSISRDGETITQLSTSDGYFPVDPGETRDVYVEWETAGERGGDYVASFVVDDVAAAEPLRLGESDVEFRLEPLGTFTRAGEMVSMELTNRPEPGGVAQVEAVFANTGEIEAQAIFTGELRSGGELVETFESLPRRVPASTSGALAVTFEELPEGDYEVTGLINFDGFETDNHTLEFAVEPLGTAALDGSTDGGDGFPVTVVAIAAAALVAAGLGATLLTRRRRTATDVGHPPAGLDVT